MYPLLWLIRYVKYGVNSEKPANMRIKQKRITNTSIRKGQPSVKVALFNKN